MARKVWLRGKKGEGMFALVDDADFERVSAIKWCLLPVKNLRYAKSNNNLLLHRFIMEPPADMCIDHINGNGLDNRRCNLRVCTLAENNRWAAERRMENPKPRKPHVVHARGKWYVYATRGGPNILVSAARPTEAELQNAQQNAGIAQW